MSPPRLFSADASRTASPTTTTAFRRRQVLAERFHDLYELVQRSAYVFGSPLGPFYHQSRHYHLPRFIYFGPHTSNESLRLAFLAGEAPQDVRGTQALLHFVERLALEPELGQGLSLSFFPLLDALGLFAGVADRELALKSWSAGGPPELELLEKDARLQSYHGYVRIETRSRDREVVVVQLRGYDDESSSASGVELISSEDFHPWPVVFEAAAASALQSGPLSVAQDLSIRPFELTISLPVVWSEEEAQVAVGSILTRFILRHRGHQAYGQHL